MSSNEWRDKVRRLIRERGRRCEHCGSTNRILQGHHRNYDRPFGKERDEDIEIVCYPNCHKYADRERARETNDHQWQKRVNAWAAKVYGPQWFSKFNFDQVAQEFNQWLKTQE